jgi:hypothetical protein
MSDNINLIAATRVIEMQADTILRLEEELEMLRLIHNRYTARWYPLAKPSNMDYTSIGLGRRTIHDHYPETATETWTWHNVNHRQRIYTRLLNIINKIARQHRIICVTLWLHRDPDANSGISPISNNITKRPSRFYIHIQHRTRKMYLRDNTLPDDDPIRDKYNGYAGIWDPATSHITYLFVKKYMHYLLSGFGLDVDILNPYDYGDNLNESEPPNCRFNFQTGEPLHPTTPPTNHRYPDWVRELINEEHDTEINEMMIEERGMEIVD